MPVRLCSFNPERRGWTCSKCLSQKVAEQDSHSSLLLRPHAPGGKRDPLGPPASGQVSFELFSSICFMLPL